MKDQHDPAGTGRRSFTVGPRHGRQRHGAGPNPRPHGDQVRMQDPIYGSQLMTLQERNEYQTRMRQLKTEQEREAYRLEHHQQMQERARAKGVALPDAPPTQRPAMGAGPGAGPGAGMGGGTGAGAGGGMGGGAGGKK